MSIGKIIGIIVAIAIIVLIVFAVTGGGEKAPVSEGIVATVNGEEITQEELDAQVALTLQTLQTQGANVDDPNNQAVVKEQVLNDLINNRLVLQGVTGANVVVSDEAVETEFNLAKEQSGGEEAFQTALTQAGISEEQLRENIRQQLSVQQYLRDNVDVDSASATEAEITAFYDDNVASQADAPALEEVSDQIRQQIIANKQQVLINDFLTTLRASANVEIFTDETES